MTRTDIQNLLSSTCVRVSNLSTFEALTATTLSVPAVFTIETGRDMISEMWALVGEADAAALADATCLLDDVAHTLADRGNTVLANDVRDICDEVAVAATNAHMDDLA